MAGGPAALAKAAAEAAARQELEFWLRLLERIKQEDLDTRGRMMCSLYIRSLRRKLGIRTPQSKEQIREQTRLRVRRFRERAKSG